MHPRATGNQPATHPPLRALVEPRIYRLAPPILLPGSELLQLIRLMVGQPGNGADYLINETICHGGHR